MKAVASGKIDVDGSTGAIQEEIDVTTSAPEGIAYYQITYVIGSGSGVVAFRPAPLSTVEDAAALGDVAQSYPQTTGAQRYADGNPYLIANNGTASTVIAYTVYALTDERP